VNSISIEDIYKNIGQMIKKSRQNHKPSPISQQTLARKANLSRTSIVNIEKGKHHIQIHTLFSIAQSLNVGLIELLPTIDTEKTLKITSSTELTPQNENSVKKIINKIQEKR
jgi:DNA-binding XRE family transcriptional regulator